MADQLTLLDNWFSPFAARVKIALREKGLDFESITQDLSNKSPLLLEMNPVHKQIPVLIHNGNPVCESLIIVQYIDEVWNNKPPLLPSHPYERARARFWADYIDKKIYSAGRQVMSGRGEEQAAAKKEVIESLKLLESEMGDKPYFGGDAFGFVDVSLLPFYNWFYALETIGDLSLDLSEVCPKLVSWGKRSMEKETVSKSLPDHQKLCEIIMERKKNQDK